MLWPESQATWILTRRITNAFLPSQFAYCPITLMFHSRKLSHKIIKLSKQCLRLVYHDTTSSFEELLQKVNSFSTYHRNIQVLATEMFRVHKELSPKIMAEVFPLSQPLNSNIRHQPDFSKRIVKGVYYDTESLGYLGPKTWKNAESLETFKSRIKKWEKKECHCSLCETFIHQVGLI